MDPSRDCSWGADEYQAILAVFVPLLAVTGRRRAAVIATMTTVSATVIGLVGLGPAAFASWVRGLTSVTWAGMVLNASILGVVKRLFTSSEGLAWSVAPIVAAPAIVVPIWIVLAVVLFLFSCWAVSHDKSIGGD